MRLACLHFDATTATAGRPRCKQALFRSREQKIHKFRRIRTSWRFRAMSDTKAVPLRLSVPSPRSCKLSVQKHERVQLQEAV